MTKTQENKLRKELKLANEAHQEVVDHEESSGEDQAQEIMYCEGEINAITRVFKIMGIKP